jgi:hypothetical protein
VRVASLNANRSFKYFGKEQGVSIALALIAGGDPHTAPGLPGHEPDLAAGRKTAVALTAAADELRAIAPVAGSYVSEDYFFNQSRC